MQGTVSVVGDFNDWQPGVTTFRGRGSIRSATVEVERGRRYAFRYVTEAGEWIDDEESDGYERNEEGVLTGVVDLTSNGTG
jgi:1,4-alpha-glucan branching enzyme